jgi:hypothetical protein
MDNFCTNLAPGPRHHSLFHQDQWHLAYRFADAAHADLFREKFGGETLSPEARARQELAPVARPQLRPKALRVYP